MTKESDELAAEIKTLSFERALKQLEEIVQKLEKGQVDLEDSIAIYERGTALKAHCEAKLKSAEARIEWGKSGNKGYSLHGYTRNIIAGTGLSCYC